jgi:hypothetical protein
MRYQVRFLAAGLTGALILFGSLSTARRAVADAVKSVLVSDLDQPARQPVQGLAEVIIPTGKSASSPLTYMVPAGKRLVIEWASVDVGGVAAGTNAMAVLGTIAGGTGASHHLSTSQFAALGTTFPDQVFAGPLRIYADPLTEVSLYTVVSTASGAVTHMSFSGYLVDLP